MKQDTKSSPIRITLVNISRVVNAKGGTEKIFCDMANALVNRGHYVTAVYVDKHEGLPGFQVDARVNFINAYNSSLPFFLTKFARGVRSFSLIRQKQKNKRYTLNIEVLAYRLKAVLSKIPTDIVISFQGETTCALKKVIGGSIPVVTMLHGKPDIFFPTHLPTEIKSAMETSDVVQVLRPEFVDQLHQHLPSANIEVIPNWVPQYSQIADRSSSTIIHVGRLAPEKRQILLVQAFALIKNRFPNWKIELWGETHCNQKYTEEVQTTIRQLGLEKDIQLCGSTDNIPKELSNASIFAFPSENEGFPLALTEAMSMGLPSIGCKECSAVNTLIRDNENGLLCDDTPQSIADSLAKLMSNEELRIRLGNSAKEDMKAYAPECIWNQWENVLTSLVQSHKHHS